MKLYPNPGSDDRHSVYPGKNGPPAGLPDPHEVLRVHWSGYACGWNEPIADRDAYYRPRLDETEGFPVSGDELARWSRFQCPHGGGWRGWPRYADIAHVLYPHGIPSADTAGTVAVLGDEGEIAGHALIAQDALFQVREPAMSIQPKYLTFKHRAVAQQAARSAQETAAQIEKLRTAAQAAADSERFTEWLTRHARRLEELAEKGQCLADLATEVCMNAQHLDGEHLAEVAGTACRASDDIYRIYLSISR